VALPVSVTLNIYLPRHQTWRVTSFSITLNIYIAPPNLALNQFLHHFEYLYRASKPGAYDDLLVSSKRVTLISNSKRVTYLLSHEKASHVQQVPGHYALVLLIQYNPGTQPDPP